MSRIFATLFWLSFAFLAVALIAGFGLRTVDIRDPLDGDAVRWKNIHLLAGLTAGLTVVFVNSIVVTYFIGTSRWCKEVAGAYKLDPQFVRRTGALKRRAFPFALANMLVVVVVLALGAAADPAGSVQTPAPAGLTWGNVHLLGAMLGLGIILAGSFFEAVYIRANHGEIDQVMAEVRRIRAERNLD